MVKHFNGLVKKIEKSKRHSNVYTTQLFDCEIATQHGALKRVFDLDWRPLELTAIRRLLGGNYEYRDQYGRKWMSSYTVIAEIELPAASGLAEVA